MHSSMNLFLLYTLIVLFYNPKNMHLLLLSASSDTKLFELGSSTQGLTFLGDSHLQHGDIVLTNENVPINAPTSAGVVLYSHPKLFLAHSKGVPSFRTMFAFSIRNINRDEEAFADGLAFLISPDGHLLGSPGYLGLVDANELTKKKFIAIEFDTKFDSMFQDPDDNHVGLDIDSLSSVKLATSSSLGVNLKSGDLISTWIDYKGTEKRLEVFVSDSYLKPNKPILKVDIDLSRYFKKNMFVGFSAATERSMQMIRIEQWEFTIVDFSPPPPPPPPFPTKSGRTFHPEHRHSHLSSFGIGIILELCFVPFVLLFVWFYWKKLMGFNQRSEGTNNLETSGAISCQEVQFSILVDEVGRGFNIEKVLNNVAEAIHVKTVKSSIPLCTNLPAVKPSGLPFSPTVCHQEQMTSV